MGGAWPPNSNFSRVMLSARSSEQLHEAEVALRATGAEVAAYAADGDTDRANPKLFVKDSVITTKIKSKLAAEHAGSCGAAPAAMR